MLNQNSLEKIDSLVKKLYTEKDKWESLAIAIDLSDEVMKLILPNNPEWQNMLSRDVQNTLQLPDPLASDIYNNQKQYTWFNEYPGSASARMALRHFHVKDCPIESNFYWFSDSATKQKISVSTEFTSNWEDSDLTRKPDFKVGIDFFLKSEANSLLMVISNRQKLRVLEFKERLSNTQKQILMDNLNGAGAYTGIVDGKRLEFEPQRTIHQTLWDALQLHEVNKKFYQVVASYFDDLVVKLVTDNNIDHENAKQFSSRLLGRLLFIWFLRKMDIINEEFGYFDTQGVTSTEYYDQKLKILFFETLNTPKDRRFHSDSDTPYLNGGLFEAKPNDFIDQVIEFPKDYFKKMYTHFDEFNFTTDESSSEYELIAVDPEMLGHVFESLLASQIDENGSNERKETGAFYTPREIVDYMCKETLRKYLYDQVENEQFNQGIDFLLDWSDSEYLTRKSTSQADIWGVNSKRVIEMIKSALDNFKVLDPACGSGAYPMGMLQLLLKTYERIDTRFDPYKLKLSIIENSIFGVDIQPMAIEISRLRAWLSVIVEEIDRKNIQPLPNLDFKFVCANSLIPLAKDTNLFADPDLDKKLQEIRNKYFNARKAEKKLDYQRQYRTLTGAVYVEETNRSTQLKSFDPFKSRNPADFFNAHFMFGVTDGFDAVIGNPPYLGESGHKNIFDPIKPTSLGKRFYLGKMDLFYFFFHLGIDNLKNKGVLAFITTNYYPTADGALKLRQDFKTRAHMLSLINFNEYKIFESAKGQHNLITILQRETEPSPDHETQEVLVKVQGGPNGNELGEILSGKFEGAVYSSVKAKDLFDGEKAYIRFPDTSSSIEQILSGIQKKSTTLDQVCSVNQGVVPGALTVTSSHLNKYPNLNAKKGDPIFIFPAGDLEKMSGNKQAEYIVPYFKNSDIYRYVTEAESDKELLYSDGNINIDDSIIQYLKNFKEILISRREFKDGKRPWYNLHWPRSPKIFNGEKIVVPYRSHGNTFAYNNFPFYGSTDMYFINNKDGGNIDLLALVGILNSKLMFVWLYLRGKRKGEVLELFTTPLKELPIVVPDQAISSTISGIVSKIISAKSNHHDADISLLENQIDSIVFNLYGLEENEAKVILDFFESHHGNRSF